MNSFGFWLVCSLLMLACGASSSDDPADSGAVADSDSGFTVEIEGDGADDDTAPIPDTAPDLDDVEDPPLASLPSYWQMASSCMVTNEAGDCVNGGGGDFIYLGDGSIRHLYWYDFQGAGTGGIGSALSTDGGQTFSQEPGFRVVSSGVDGTWDYQIDQVVVFGRPDGWGVLAQNNTQAPVEGVNPGTRSYLFTTPDGTALTPMGPAIGSGSSTADIFDFVGRGGAFRLVEGDQLRAVITCEITGVVYGGVPSDMCAMRSDDDGVSWTLDTDPSVHPWVSDDRGETWTQDTSVSNGIVIADGNEAYIFPLPGGGWGTAFTYVNYGVFGSTSADGIHWSEPARLDMRNPDGITSCYYEDSDGNGEYAPWESELNCGAGDVSVILRADGRLAIVSDTPESGMMQYIAQP